MKTTFIKTLLAFTFSLIAPFAIAQNTINGTVVDSDNDPIPGVNIVVQGTNQGVVSDFDGNYTITTSQALPFNLVISSVGFGSQTIEVTSADQQVNVSMASGTKLDEIVVSASRRPESVQNSPASVSILSSADIQNSPYVQDPVAGLVNVPGVQLQQQSANSLNLEMRAGAGVFGTGTFVMMDYRFLVSPSAGTFLTYQSGISGLDLQQIEVVRGPAGALYGPNVTSGIVHFITKSAIDHPGTSAEIFAGSQARTGGAIRHAQSNSSGTFGWKINARYAKGDEFKLDPVADAGVISDLFKTVSQPAIKDGVVDGNSAGTLLLGESDLDPDGDGNPLLNEYSNYSANIHMEFRPSSTTTGFLAAGMANGNGLFFNAQGYGQINGNDYWAQARINSGRWFMNAYYNTNDGGDEKNPTFLYGTGFRQVAKRTALEAQVQYNFEIPSLNSSFIAGFDYRNNGSDTANTLYGRNEADDDFLIAGAYLQGTTDLSDQLTLTYTGRYDKLNFIDEGKFAPKVALVFKPDPRNSFRASYSVATYGPSALQTFIDFPVAILSPGVYDVWLSGQTSEQTFAPPAQQVFELAGLGISLPVATPGLPNAVITGGVGALSAAGAVGALSVPNAALGYDGSALAPFAPILEGFLSGYNAAGGPAGVNGTFRGFNLFNPSETMAYGTDAGKARLGTVETWEVGYKGLIEDKWAVGLDVYSYNLNGFTQFTALAPTFGLTGFDSAAYGAQVGADVAAGVTAPVTAALLPLVTAGVTAAVNGGIVQQVTAGYQAAATQLAGAGITFESLSANGLDAATAAAISALIGATVAPMPNLANAIAGTQASVGPGLIAGGIASELPSQVATVVGGLAGFAGGAYTIGGDGLAALGGGVLQADGTYSFQAMGSVESNRVPANDGITHVSAGYRSYDDAVRSHYGADLSVDFSATKNLTLWGNASWLSQNVWTPGDYGDDGLLFPQFLNAPLWKYRLGARLVGDNGFRASISFQHDDSFESNQGFFGGTTDEKNLVDFSIGKKVGPIQLDIAATNLFDQKYRAFPGMPIIERTVVLKAGFNF
jgi:outer membrane receptor for ferrienterochelin and colicins